MSALIILENCPECNVEVSYSHTENCKTELCKTCGLSTKHSNGCQCKKYVPMSTIWNGQILNRSDSLFPYVSWILLFKIREAINAELEELRQTKVIGKGTDAGVIVSLSSNIRNMISMLPEELAEFCCVSEFTFENHSVNNEIIVSVISLKDQYEKCERCLRYNKTVSIHDYWPTYKLCSRCIDVLLELR
jgi:hypothetical protein